MSDKDDTKGTSGNDGQGRNGSGNGSDTPQGKLEALLNEWDQKNSQGTDSGKPAEPKDGKPAGTGDGDQLTKRLERIESLLDQTNYRSDMDRIVSQVKGELDIDEGYVEWWVNQKAENDPRLVQLWNERDNNKGQFRKVIQSLTPEFREHVKERGLAKPKSETDDGDGDDSGEGKGRSRDDKGLSAAVRNSREATPSGGDFDDVNWAGLSDHEFALKRAEVFEAMRKGKLRPE